MKPSRIATAYAAAAAAAFVGLVVAAVAPEGRVVATLLLMAASAASLSLAIWAPAFVTPWFRRRPLATYGLLAGFNAFVMVGGLIEAVALVILLVGAEPDVPATLARATWFVPAGLAMLQTGVLLERRADGAAFRPSRTPAVLAGLLGGVGVMAWVNAVFAGAADLFFVTGKELAAGQGVYLLLLGNLLMALATMVLFRVPTVFELLVNRRDEWGQLRAVTSTSPLLSSLLITANVLAVAVLAAAGRDSIPLLGQVVPAPAWARLLFVVVIVLAGFLVTAGIMTVRRSRRPLYRTKLSARQRATILVSVISALLTVFFLWLIIGLYTQDAVDLAGFRLTAAWRHEAVVTGILAATGPAGFYVYGQHRRDQSLEERLADFLADLSEATNAGLSLHAALQAAQRKDYGHLNEEVHRMATQASWGVTFEEVFARFGQRSRSRMVQRTANLVVESSRSGGNTPDVLKAAAHDVFEIKALESERRIAMTTYLIVIYVVFFVFLAILAVLAVAFIPPLMASTQAASGGQNLFASRNFDADGLKAAYFHAVLVQAVGNGAVAGVIRENRMTAGLRHIFLMVILAYLVFKMLIL
jgi:hypothetical protein